MATRTTTGKPRLDFTVKVTDIIMVVAFIATVIFTTQMNSQRIDLLEKRQEKKVDQAIYDKDQEDVRDLKLSIKELTSAVNGLKEELARKEGIALREKRSRTP